MISWNVNPTIIPDETSIHLHAAIVVEGTGHGVVPEMDVSGGCLHVLVGLFDGGHDHRSEMFWGQDYHLIVIVLSLVMICSARKEVRLLVAGTGFMVKGKMVFCQLGDPSSLSSIYFLGLSEVLEILVIHPDLEILVGAHKVVSPFFEREHDRKSSLS